ncbi:helix-turn-helix domain-containing protein [Streptomyces sp. AK04-3B]|nr:helix-turn-helix domain-containing protein [Streptomyces sp. AK04-3B]
MRFATLAALCEALTCRPGDLLRREAEDAASGCRPPGRPRGIPPVAFQLSQLQLQL